MGPEKQQRIAGNLRSQRMIRNAALTHIIKLFTYATLTQGLRKLQRALIVTKSLETNAKILRKYYCAKRKSLKSKICLWGCATYPLLQNQLQPFKCISPFCG